MTACQSENRAAEEAMQGGREGSKAKGMKKGKPK
jgi:hypothetical protein